MKKFKLIPLITLVSLASVNAQAGIMQKSLSTIESNSKLQSQLISMGYETAEDAANAFEEASQKLEANGINVNLGTLAICGKGTIELVDGKNSRVCTTLFNIYSVEAETKGIAASMALTLSAIYFYSSTPDHDQICFKGARVAGGFDVYGGAEALGEVSCDGKSKGDFSGLFVGFDFGFGMGGAVSKTKITVTKVDSYWN